MSFLSAINNGQRLGKKLKLKLIRLIAGTDVPDVVKTLMYRPEFFGAPHAKLHEAVMRGPSDWSVEEREVLATVVSDANACRFCTAIHREVAIGAGAVSLMDEVLADPLAATASPKLRAAVVFVRKLTLQPDEISPADIAPMKAAGISDDAVVDAIHITWMFCVMNRLMDGFGSTMPTPKQLGLSRKILLERGYDAN